MKPRLLAKAGVRGLGYGLGYGYGQGEQFGLGRGLEVQPSACDQSGDEQQPPVRRVVPGASSILSPHRGLRSAVPG